MAEDLSITIMVGRLTRDLDLQYTNSGYSIGVCNIAVNSREKKGEEWIDSASFFEIKLLGKRAESLAQYMLKGTKVAVQGRLKQERWQDRQSNLNRSKVILIVNSIQLLGDGKKSESSSDQNKQQPNVENRNSKFNENHYEQFEDDIPF